MGGRLILDVSSLARWTGPPVGIARVEHALARRALRRPGTLLSFFDRAEGRFRSLKPEWAELVTGWLGAVDTGGEGRARSGWRALVPSRQPVVSWLERRRLLTRSPLLAGLADGLQRAILAPRRHGTPLRDAGGRRIAHVPADLALGEAVVPGPGDVLLSAGSDWFHLDAAQLGEMKRRHGFRYATLCYDLIPATHPQFFRKEDVRLVRDHWRRVLPLADLVVVNARCIAADLGRFCQDAGLPEPATAVLPLGFDPPPPGPAAAPLPAGLRAGHYALFVSTIEPRKGHALLLRAWRNLLRRGLPQRRGFQLVFVGRPGWMVEEVLQQLADPAPWDGSLLHLSGVAEAELDALYDGAAFCLYPSRYEGFGLPVIEAFARGKPVLASTGGAVPETVGGLAPCLDPEDAGAWEAALAEWIEHPASRDSVAVGIRAGFAHPDWDTAAAAILEAAAALTRRG
ncbi:glycosyltransferase family 4 protein [Roseomonas sp. BN140053]|uniref:glycosyltransferase family 4 protein n=1 Tax=Roseomonas sp. BN140053 TaxID=3391898 RepID=UPI0039ED17C2